MARQRGQHHGDLRPALLEAALDLLDEGGADEVTLRAVARRAGVSAAAPYHHFADKAALLSAVALDGFRGLRRVQEAVVEDDALDRVASLTGAYVTFAMAHRSHYAVMFDALTPSADPELQATARAAFDDLAAAVALAAPRLSAAEAATRALHVWSQAHGAVGLADVARGLNPDLDHDELARGAASAARAMVAATGAGQTSGPGHR